MQTSKIKKFVRNAALVIALTAAMSTCAMALTSDQADSGDIEVRIENAEELSESETARIKNGVIAVYLSGEDASDSVSTHNLTCTLFGHDKQTRNASLIEHQVNKKAPRCKQVYYKVITCSRCDYMDTETISSSYIYCCAED